MGAQLRVYRQKIRSAKATKKITRAMELISASRIQKAQQRMSEAGPYAPRGDPRGLRGCHLLRY
jgi:F-type H+-transporting ATPase subunit gamma